MTQTIVIENDKYTVIIVEKQVKVEPVKVNSVQMTAKEATVTPVKETITAPAPVNGPGTLEWFAPTPPSTEARPKTDQDFLNSVLKG